MFPHNASAGKLISLCGRRKKNKTPEKGIKTGPEVTPSNELLVWHSSYQDCWCETLTPTTVATPRGILIKTQLSSSGQTVPSGDGRRFSRFGSFRGNIIFCGKAKEPSWTLGNGKLICCMASGEAVSLVLLLTLLCLTNMMVTPVGQKQSFTIYLFSSSEKSAYLSGNASHCACNRDPNWQ